MSREIRLRWKSTCSDCGSCLPKGTLAAYYGPGHVYGREGCHAGMNPTAPSATVPSSTLASGVTIQYLDDARLVLRWDLEAFDAIASLEDLLDLTASNNWTLLREKLAACGRLAGILLFEFIMSDGEWAFHRLIDGDTRDAC